MGQLVGREDETARLHAFVAELAGGPSALVVEGEPGIGKTALFEALLAQAAGPRVLRARCAQAESGLAYAGLADLLGRVTDTVLAALPSPQRRPLEVVLGRAEVGQDPVEPHLVGRATLGVLRSLAAATPLLVALDDVQWLDPAAARCRSGWTTRCRKGAGIGCWSVRSTPTTWSCWWRSCSPTASSGYRPTRLSRLPRWRGLPPRPWD